MLFNKKVFFCIVFIMAINLNAKSLFFPLEEPKNINKEVATLGKELFFDPILSKNNDISCFSCHSNYGADNKSFSIGTNNKIGKINSPSVFNLEKNIAYFWNGRAETLEKQLHGPLFDSSEMASSKELIEERLKNSQKYKELFNVAFKSEPSFANTLKAIAEYEKTLVTLNSKFDKHLRGEVALNESEQKGLNLFISYGCASCHNGLNLGGNSFQKFGAVISPDEFDNEIWADRFAFTNDIEDKEVYKVPSLRNVEKTAPYFHNGQIWSLNEAVKEMGSVQLGINISDEDSAKIVTFLKALKGDKPKIVYPQLPESTIETEKPTFN